MSTALPEIPLILNVDDDLAGRYVKNRSLRLGGWEVVDADSGTAALQLVEQLHPALVLLDINMPDINGLEVCRRIKDRWPDVIVVQISATAVSSADRITGLESGADCYLTMPVDPTELVAVTQAMLRLRRAEAQAQASNERYRMIVESAIDYAIFTCGLDGRVTSWNRGSEAILGYTSAEIIGEPCERIFMADDVANDVAAKEMRCARRGESVRAERWHRRRDGTRFWSSGRIVPLRDACGEVAGFLKILYDRTAEKEARDALISLNEQLETRVAERTAELEAANERLLEEMAERDRTGEQIRQLQKMEAIGHLTGGIAHDFNNLLTAILGALEIVRRRVEEPRAVRLLDSATSAAERGSRLVKQLLAFARKQDLALEAVTIPELIREMRDLLERSIGSSIIVRYAFDPDIWPVNADANQLQAALLNLSINARDAMPDGGCLVLSGRNIPGAGGDGDCVEICVTDTGTGMTDEVKARVFEPFFTTKDVGRGTGLGLAQVYGFVRQCGGDVALESEIGKGTTVRLRLPRSSSSAVAADTAAATR